MLAVLACLLALAAPDEPAEAKAAEALRAMGQAERATSQGTNVERANAWWALQKAADRLAAELDRASPSSVVAEEASRLGVTIEFCEIGREWIAKGEGYASYLNLLPNGEHRDEAWWNTLVEPPACGDFEPTVEGYEAAIARYQRFIDANPKSRLVSRAEAQLSVHRRGLQELLERRNPPRPAGDCTDWAGNFTGNDRAVRVRARLCTVGHHVVGTVDWSGKSGNNVRRVEGDWDDKLTKLQLRDVEMISQASAPGWMFCMIDRYDLVRTNHKLAGQYWSKACKDEASIELHLVSGGP